MGANLVYKNWELLGDGPVKIRNISVLHRDGCWNLVKNCSTIFHVKNGATVFHQTSALIWLLLLHFQILSSSFVTYFKTCSHTSWGTTGWPNEYNVLLMAVAMVPYLRPRTVLQRTPECAYHQQIKKRRIDVNTFQVTQYFYSGTFDIDSQITTHLSGRKWHHFLFWKIMPPFSIKV